MASIEHGRNAGTGAERGIEPAADLSLSEASIAGDLREELVRELSYERIDQATSQAIAGISADPELSRLAEEHGFAAGLEEKAYVLKVAIYAGLPIQTETVDWRGTRMEEATRPLLETAEALNAERGFDSPEKIAEAFRIEDERIERQVGSIEKAIKGDSVSWGDMPTEAREALYAFTDGIRASIPSPMQDEHLAPYARYPLVLDALQEIYAERGFAFERPALVVAPGESFLERRMRSAEEMIGKQIQPESLREVGSGSEGQIYYARTSDGAELAIKIKNPDVEMVGNTVTVVGSLRLSSAMAEPLVPIRETKEIAVSPFIPGAPTLEDLAVHLNDPGSTAAKPAVSEMLESYRSAHPEDPDLSDLKRMVSATVSELSRAVVPAPFTAKPINFLATGVSDGKLRITCVDPV